MIELENISTLPPAEYSKKETKKKLKKQRKALFDLQKKFYADSRYSILIIMQGVHTAGKNGSIRNAFSGMNPSGVKVKSFKKPTKKEENHDFLYRIYPHFPAKGMIGVFNRSYYEDILVPRVSNTLTGEVLQHRINLINHLEQHLLYNKTIIVKFFLHISAEEQIERIKERKEKSHKHWKYKPKDDEAPSEYDDYQQAYQAVLNSCNRLPWHIIPSDKRWYRNYKVAEILRQQMENLDLQYPSLEEEKAG